jgi:hypothetical protein
MATELTVQSERAFQKQPHIFTNHKGQAAKSKRKGKGGRRWFKDVGLGFRTPKTAVDGSYIGMSMPPSQIGRGAMVVSANLLECLALNAELPCFRSAWRLRMEHTASRRCILLTCNVCR